MNQTAIGGYIARKRKEQNLTQEQLAQQLGVSNKTISKWENGVSHTLKEEYWSPENQLWRRVALGAARLRAGAPFFAPASVMESRRAGIGMILLAF